MSWQFWNKDIYPYINEKSNSVQTSNWFKVLWHIIIKNHIASIFPMASDYFFFYSYSKYMFLFFSELGTYSHVYSRMKIIVSPHNYLLRVTLAELYEIYMDISKSGVWCKDFFFFNYCSFLF